MTQKKNLEALKSVLLVLPQKRQTALVLLVLATIVSAALEAILLVTVMDTIRFLKQGSLSDGTIARLAPRSLVANPDSAGIFMVTLLAFSVVLTTITRVALVKSTARIAYSAGHDISMKLLERYLKVQISYFAASGSASLIGSINRVQILSHTVFMPILRSIPSVFQAVAIVSTLIFASPVTALLATAIIGGTYAITTLVLRSRLHRNGQIISKMQEKRISVLRESVGSIREIKLYENGQVFEQEFDTLETKFRNSQAENLYFAQLPRYIIEATGLILLGALVFASTQDVKWVSTSIPAIGALAVGAQRMLPLVQQVFLGWAQYSGSAGVIADIADTLNSLARNADPDYSRNETGPLAWKRLVFDNVEYRHSEDANPAISSATFSLEKGDKVVISGQTGSGKSTLIDLIMSFRSPTRGRILVDQTEMSEDLAGHWHRQIALVPQTTFMLDGTIRDNILFGKTPTLEDEALIREVLHLTDLDDTVRNFPNGLDTAVGEDGVRLSGGQRQRLSMARALFRNRPILVMDEATSALDVETEKKILERLELEKPDLTVVHITHRAQPTARATKHLKVVAGVAKLIPIS